MQIYPLIRTLFHIRSTTHKPFVWTAKRKTTTKQAIESIFFDLGETKLREKTGAACLGCSSQADVLGSAPVCPRANTPTPRCSRCCSIIIFARNRKYCQCFTFLPGKTGNVCFFFLLYLSGLFLLLVCRYNDTNRIGRMMIGCVA